MSSKNNSHLFTISQIDARNDIKKENKKEKKKTKKEKFIVFQNFKTNNNVFPSGIKNPVKKENEIDEKSLSFDIDINIGNQAEKNNDISEINLIEEIKLWTKKIILFLKIII